MSACSWYQVLELAGMDYPHRVSDEAVDGGAESAWKLSSALMKIKEISKKVFKKKSKWI